MQNTNYCPSCDVGGRTREVTILGKPVTVKNYVCSADGVNYPLKQEPVQLQMSVCPTMYCEGKCPFCIAKNIRSKQKLDVGKFARVMQMLKAENRIRGVKITGGEPFGDTGLLNEVICILFETFGYDLELSVSTNGMRLDRLHEIRDLSHIEAIHISRHHDDDAVNRAIFGGADVPSGENLREIVGTVSYRDLFVFNCMLLRDYLHTPEDAHRFLDFTIGVGVPKVGFMTCSPINAYAQAQMIPFESVLREDDPALLFTRGFYDYEYCHCRDGVYVSPEGKIVEFYGRSTRTDGCRYARGLVYGADDHLRDGFGGEIIF